EAVGRGEVVEGDPVGGGRFQGDRIDLVLTQEGGHGLQAGRVSRELPDRAGIGVGGEADADPVGARADVDAGGVRALPGQASTWAAPPWRGASLLTSARVLRRWSGGRWAWA